MATIKLIAFDQSTTSTGYCVMDYDSAEIIKYGLLKPKGETTKRISTTVKQSLSLAQMHQVQSVYIEGVQYQKNAKVFEILAKLSGTMEICFIEAGYDTHVVKSSEWRRRVGIVSSKRKDNKKQAINLVKNIYKTEASEDECEAICFARAFTSKKETTKHGA